MKIGVKSGTSSFTSGALILAAAGIVSKLLGAIYRIPLTNILGAEGIGMYQLIFPIYALMLTLSSSAIPTAVSRLVSEQGAMGNSIGKYKVLKTAGVALLVTCSVATLIMYLISSPLARLQGNEYIKFGYYAVAPSIIIVGGSAVFKGWFQGNMNMMPTASAQVVEQFAKMVFGLMFAKLLLPKGLVYAVSGALVGLTLAEFLAFCAMAIIYLTKKESGIGRVKISFDNAQSLIKVTAPIMLSGMIFPIIQFVDSILIVRILGAIGLDDSVATAQYGLLTGTVNSLINMPVVVTLALAIAIVPVVAKHKAQKNALNIKEKSNFALKLAYLLAVPCFVFFIIFAEPIVNILYPSLNVGDIQTSVSLLRLSSFSIVAISILQVYTALLQAIGKTLIPVKNLAVSGAVKIALDFLLIGSVGIAGGAVASVISMSLACLLNAMSYRKLLGKRKLLLKNISKIYIISVIIGLLSWIVILSNLNKYFLLALGGGIFICAYPIVTLIVGVLSDEELKNIPLGGKLIKYNNLLGKKISKGG